MHLALLCLIASVNLGASAQVQDSFVVNVPVSDLAVWLSGNSDRIATAAGSHVTRISAREIAIQKSTPRGYVRARLSETLDAIPGGYAYRARLIPGTSDTLTFYVMECTLLPEGAGASRVSITVTSAVTMRVRDAQMRSAMRDNMRSVRAFLQSLYVQRHGVASWPSSSPQ